MGSSKIFYVNSSFDRQVDDVGFNWGFILSMIAVVIKLNVDLK